MIVTGGCQRVRKIFCSHRIGCVFRLSVYAVAPVVGPGLFKTTFYGFSWRVGCVSVSIHALSYNLWISNCKVLRAYSPYGYGRAWPCSGWSQYIESSRPSTQNLEAMSTQVSILPRSVRRPPELRHGRCKI